MTMSAGLLALLSALFCWRLARRPLRTVQGQAAASEGHPGRTCNFPPEKSRWRASPREPGTGILGHVRICIGGRRGGGVRGCAAAHLSRGRDDE